MNWFGWAMVLLLLPLTIYVVAEDPQTLDVVVLGATDAHDTDRVTEIVVRVHNPGPDAVEPVFSVPASALMNWYAWTFDGPELLEPGATGTYVLTQPAYTGVPVTHGFRVIVNDGNIEGRSALFHAHVDARPSVINPGFLDWAPSMFNEQPLPYGWAPFHVLHGGSVDIQGTDGNFTIGLDADGPEVSLASLHQRIDFPSTFRVEMRAIPEQGLAGVILEELSQKRRVELVFGPEGTRRFDANGTEVLRVSHPGPVLDVDLQALYNANQWDIPAKAFVDRKLPQGPGDMGVGLRGLPLEQGRLEFFRPIEMRAFVAAPHPVAATFAFAGGPALDPAPTRS